MMHHYRFPEYLTWNVCSQVVLSLAFNNSLRQLNISWNRFNSDGINDLCKVLAKNNTLQSLNLANCGLDKDKYGECIGKMLRANRALLSLHLPANSITDKAAMYIAKGIEGGGNNTLTDVIAHNYQHVGSNYLINVCDDDV
jgi:hypothetical protein